MSQGEKWWNFSRLRETKTTEQSNVMSEFDWIQFEEITIKSILETSGEMLIWTGVLDDIREVISNFLK